MQQDQRGSSEEAAIPLQVPQEECLIERGQSVLLLPHYSLQKPPNSVQVPTIEVANQSFLHDDEAGPQEADQVYGPQRA